VRIGLALIAVFALACAQRKATLAQPRENARKSTVAPSADVVAVDPMADRAVASAERAKRLEGARAALDAGTWDGGELYAAAVRAPVMNVPASAEPTDGGSDPAAPSVYRLGYLRHGSHAPVLPEPIVNDDCPEGWYELLQGGFICGKFASTDPKAPSVRFAANPPKLASAMPYRYGFALGDETPVYRRVLSLTDRRKFEPWLVPPAAPLADGGASLPSSGDAGLGAEGEETENPYGDEATEKATAKGKRPSKEGPAVTLSSLKGRGVLARKMMKGFFVALDRDFTAAKAHWWRTAEGFAIPYERIALQSWSPDFHGSWVSVPDPARHDEREDGGEVPEGDGVAALVSSAYAVRYLPNAKGKMIYGAPISKWTLLEFAGEPTTVDGVAFRRTTAGFWIRVADAMVATPEPPSDLAEKEKWIDVDLSRQLLVAFEGKHPVYGTRVSSGRHWSWDPEHDHPTPTGTFRIYEKHVSTTMDGDIAADGPYSIEDVPWVMYFQGGYALHGAFWHNHFGSTRSHGCINLSPIDARELFFWTEPSLPKGWHGVFQTASQTGTRVVIHEPAEPKKK
jgi:hypothetical protein